MLDEFFGVLAIEGVRVRGGEKSGERGGGVGVLIGGGRVLLVTAVSGFVDGVSGFVNGGSGFVNGGSGFVVPRRGE